MCTKPCAECPFRRHSLRGWLGPWTELENGATAFVMDSFTEEGVFCHMAVDRGVTTKRCVGSLICANLSAKRFRSPPAQGAQDALKGEWPDIMDAQQFIAYHGTAEKPHNEN